jgi:hypothetical protein
MAFDFLIGSSFFVTGYFSLPNTTVAPLRLIDSSFGAVV